MRRDADSISSGAKKKGWDSVPLSFLQKPRTEHFEIYSKVISLQGGEDS